MFAMSSPNFDMKTLDLLGRYHSGQILEDTTKAFHQYLMSKYPNGHPPIIDKPETSFLLSGGPDPLQFIYIFKNEGNPERWIPRHWHYIGSGLIDIHGYTWYRETHNSFCEKYALKTRPLPELYPFRGPTQSESTFNGFGFELTFRLKCDSDIEWKDGPPAWPRQMMQKLARYVFESKNILQANDHIVMNESLDRTDDDMDTSKIRHILFSLDPQLQREDVSPMGRINFIQIVGACEEELQAAREWNVQGILEMMEQREETGGPLLVTDMRRGETIFELNPHFHDIVRKGMERDGSSMAQSCAEHKTSCREQDWYQEVEEFMRRREEGEDFTNVEYPSRLADEINNIEFNEDDNIRDDESMMDIPPRPPSRMSQGSESALRIDNAELREIRYYDRIYILLSYESAKNLPVMLHGRLRHRYDFSFQSYKGDSLITFVPEGSPKQALVGPDIRFARTAHWLQIYVSNELRDQMIDTIGHDFDRRNSMEKPTLPRNYSWPDFKLYLTVVAEIPDM